MDTQILTLFQKYINEQCNQQELEEVFTLLKNGKYQSEWQQVIADEADQVLSLGLQSDLTQNEIDAIYAGIAKQLPSSKKTTYKLWPRIVVVAAAVVSVVLGVYFFNYRNNEVMKKVQDDLVQNDVAPGKAGATLTLASGEKIRLTHVANGELANESGISITKTADGQIVYEVKSKGSDPNQLNTLSTEKGETYILTLPDKSKVWLNAASSLTYTAALMERGVRRVKLTGEAYFEIFKDKAHPFVVESKEQQVEVLGTHFNINAYEDEFVVKTTLLEGSVKISNAGSRSSILKPGQQAVLSDRGIVLKNVEAEDAIDWKSGYFMFNNESLESGLKRIARWYNVQIVYEDESLKGETFFGRISKFEKISKVFSMLERTDIVRFKIEGNKIFVRKKK